MANYIDLPIVDELVRLAEDEPDDSTLKAMGSAILNYHFQMTDGFANISQRTKDTQYAKFFISHIKRYSPDRSLVDHTLAGHILSSETVPNSLEQLQTALDGADTHVGRCWALLLHGVNFHFYEYHRNLPIGSRLVPWGPAEENLQRIFHARRDSDRIHQMLLHMARTDSPVPR